MKRTIPIIIGSCIAVGAIAGRAGRVLGEPVQAEGEPVEAKEILKKVQASLESQVCALSG